jgi:hypothetical protein
MTDTPKNAQTGLIIPLWEGAVAVHENTGTNEKRAIPK